VIYPRCLGSLTLAAVVFLLAFVARSGSPGQRRAAPRRTAAGALDELRPVLMACLAPAWVCCQRRSHAIGAQVSSRWREVVVGGMLTTIAAVLFLVPLDGRENSAVMEGQQAKRSRLLKRPEEATLGRYAKNEVLIMKARACFLYAHMGCADSATAQSAEPNFGV